VTGLDNRGGIFPIHRSVRFVVLTSTADRPTARVACRFGIRRPDELEVTRPDGAPLVITRGLIARMSGDDDLAIPEIVSPTDLRIVEGVSARVPCLGDADGWRIQFRRELNASDDRDCFEPADGDPRARPVLEGKQIQPFRALLDRCRYQLRTTGATRDVPRRVRLAYRDVAGATNRLTLIAAVVPPRAVTTHTLFCLATALPAGAQHVLCALLNSFVANYLVRMRVNTHVTASLLSRLRAPLVDPAGPNFVRLEALSRALARGERPAERMDEYGVLQALVAHLYGLSSPDFAHVLTTFPLVAPEIKSRALARFDDRRTWNGPR
jgi:hypothetical protein